MEANGVAAAPTTTNSAVAVSVSIPSSPPHDPDFSPLGSPDIADSHLEEEEEEESTNPSDNHQHPQITSALTDDLRDKIIKQVEYYFSDANLPTDKFLMKYVTQNAEGFVPIGIIASFRKMKKLTQDKSLIVAALEESSLLVVSSSRKKVRRLYLLPVNEVTDTQLCTVLVENLPDDHSTENIQRIFGEAGDIKNICIRDPHSVREQPKRTMTEKLLSGKLHALVEYKTVDAAEKAVAMLNNEQDWRYGMRVKLLKRTVHHGQKKKGRRGPDFEKNSNFCTSDPAGGEENQYISEHHDDTHDEEDGDHVLKVKNCYKAQHQRRGRGQRYRGTNGQGHGTVSSSHGSEPSKPPPGPRMPDGTRGFSIGRGRTPASNQD